MFNPCLVVNRCFPGNFAPSLVVATVRVGCGGWVLIPGLNEPRTDPNVVCVNARSRTYHRPACRLVNPSAQRFALDQVRARFTACRRCGPPV